MDLPTYVRIIEWINIVAGYSFARIRCSKGMMGKCPHGQDYFRQGFVSLSSFRLQYGLHAAQDTSSAFTSRSNSDVVTNEKEWRPVIRVTPFRFLPHLFHCLLQTCTGTLPTLQLLVETSHEVVSCFIVNGPQ